MAKHLDPDDFPELAEAAERYSLRLIVADPAAQRYIRTGAGKPQLPPLSQSADLAGRYIGQVVDEVTLQRAQKVVLAHSQQGLPIAVTVSADVKGADKLTAGYVFAAPPDRAAHDLSGSSLVGSIAMVNCRIHRKDEQATVRSWLLGFHQALLRGYFGGVLFDGYRALPGNISGIVDADQPLAPERAAMIKRITLRAIHWHKLLEGLYEPPVELTDLGDAPVRAVILRGPKRRSLLIVNPSLDQFVRSRVNIPIAAIDPPAVRAVQFPAADQSPVGAVIDAAGPRLSIPIELAPGDAALYELFAVRPKRDR